MADFKNLKYVGKPVLRIDGYDKATGKTKYMTDLYFDNMLVGKVKRAEYPHAKIKYIDTSKAEKLNGVACVLTHKDVPGLNRFGIAITDMPVLCEDKVRYLGDAVALVAAETEEIAEKALELIEVGYEELDVIDTIEKAMDENSIKVHDDVKKANILAEKVLKKGDVKKGFEESKYIVEEEFQTQLYEHAFIETEGGIAKYDEKTGILEIFCGSQYAQRDQLQISRIMGIKEEKIRICGSPVGGAFGGKDEITVQHYLALLTYHTKRPVRLHLKRDESIISGTKRHPFKMKIKLGISEDHKIKAIEGYFYADTGAYASLGVPVMHLALETAPGPYLIENSYFHGYSLYTNNGFSGAFRGFGGTQANYAVEICIDKVCEMAKIDPIEFRRKNAIEKGDISGINHKITTACNIKGTLDVAANHSLWKEKKEGKKQDGPIRYGYGVASEFHACGLGAGLPDFAGCIIELDDDGKFVVKQGAIEIGQGNITAYAQIAAETLEIDINDIKEVTHGDTFRGPDSGSVTASKSIYVVGNAVHLAAEDMKKKMVEFANDYFSSNSAKYENGYIICDDTKYSLKDIARYAMLKGKKLISSGHFVHPVAEENFGDGLPHWVYTFITQMAKVSVDTETFEIKVEKMVSIPEMGKAINPQGVEQQSEGGAVMGMGYALYEQVMLDKSKFLNPEFTTYILPTAVDSPDVETIIVESGIRGEETHAYGAKGLGEAITVPICPAIINAIYDAVGVRINELPVTPEKLYEALKNKGE